jgi:hypothetical protein
MNLQQSPTTTVELAGARTGSETRLRGTWLVVARIAWVTIALLAVGLFVASLPSYFAYLHIIDTSSSATGPQLAPSDLRALQRLGLSLDFYAWLNTGVYFIILLVYVLVGIVLFWRKSDDRVALLASLCLMLFPIAFSTSLVATLPPMWMLPAEIVELLGDICLGLFICLFPSGRFIPRWTRWLMVVWIAFFAINVFYPHSPLPSWLFFTLFPGLVVSLIVLQVYRYRHVSTPLQRQQTKWVIFGIAFAFGPLVIVLRVEYVLLPQFFSMSPLAFTLVQMPFNLLLLLFPLSIGFAILRYRLWEIDTLVNRTLVYGTLTVSLALVYTGLVLGLQSLVGLLTGTISEQPLVIVASTLVIAALFQPLRHRIQGIIDRRFFRRKYDAAKTLEAFSATLRNEVNLDQLSEHLLAVVQETMQPEHVSLWLRKPQKDKKRINQVQVSNSLNQSGSE